jgi:hypothetical protein
LVALVGNFIYQSKQTDLKPVKKKRLPLIAVPEVRNNLILAKNHDPRFVDNVAKEYATKKLYGRRLMVYAEKLGLFNTKQSVSLMRKIYQNVSDLKVKNRIIKGLSLSKGGENEKFLFEVFEKRSELSDIEKVYLYDSISPYIKNKKMNSEIQKFFISNLNFKQPLLNFLSLRYFYKTKQKDKVAIEFSKKVLNAALKEEKISSTLFTYAINYLTQFERSYLLSYHKKFKVKLPKNFSGFYFNLVHHFCPTGVVDDLISLVNHNSTPFNLFRVASAEVKLFGGKDIYQRLKKASQSPSLDTRKKDFLKVLISKYSNMKEQKLCK